MQKRFLPLLIPFLSAIAFMQGCKKDLDDVPQSWTEEFKNVESLAVKEWLFFNNGIEATGAGWRQGYYSDDKAGGFYGFPAYSYQKLQTEYVYAGQSSFSNNTQISSWLVTPEKLMKNGDIVSFYTRCHQNIIAPHKLEVRLSTVTYPTTGTQPGDLGSFTKLLHTINESATTSGYPKTWTKVEFQVSGLSGNTRARLAFKYMSSGQTAEGIGIDQLSYKAQ